MKYLLSILTLFLIQNTLYGGEEEYVSSVEGSDVQVSGMLGCVDPQYSYMQGNPSWVNEFENVSARATISFSYLEDALESFTSESHTIDLSIDMWDENGTMTSTTVTLSIDRNNSSGSTQADIDLVAFDDVHKIQAEITGLTGTNNDQLILTSKIEVFRSYFFDVSTSITSLQNDYTHTSNEDTKIIWSAVEGAEYYDLEWVYVDDYDVDINTGSVSYINPSALNYNFYTQGTRVRVSDNYYYLPKMYAHGYLVYRVRAVGRLESNYEVMREGPWTIGEKGVVSSLSSASYFKVEAPHMADKMNWQWSAGFSEDKRFDAVSYVDGMGRGRQSVARDNTQQQVLVSNQYYDYQGRPAVTDLPSPDQDNNELIYKDFYNRGPGGVDEYGPQNFDKDNVQDPCDPYVEPMHEDYGSSNYYSDDNPDQEGAQQFVPDAKGYPFKRVEYTPDNTGRIAKVSAYGSNFTTASGHNVDKHYASVIQGEIVKLFGTEVGFASNYTKTYTTDPNGQAAVTYFNQNGQVIASGLVGSAPNGIDPLSSNTGPTQLTDVIFSGVVDQTEQTIGQISISKNFYVEADGDHSFSYTIDPEVYTDPCLPGMCYDCVYDLQIVLLDDCGDTILNEEEVIGSLPVDETCQNPSTFTIDHPNISAYLYAGREYSFYKNLKVSEAAIDTSVCSFVNNSTCLETYQDFFNDVYTEGDFVPCGPTVVSGGGGSGLAFGSYCDRKKAKMLRDVSPGGQYGQVYDASGNINVTDQLSVFNTSNVLPSGLDWQNPAYDYEDDNGNTVYVDINGTSYLAKNIPTLQQFIYYWEDSWAEALLDAHPERCYLDVCYTHEYSFDYDDDMLAVETFDEACSMGFLDPTGLLTSTSYAVQNHPPTGAPSTYFPNFMSMYCQNTSNIDPSYDNGNWGDFLVPPDLIQKMDEFWTSPDGTFGLSVWELAFVQTMCPDAHPNDYDECDAWDQPITNDCQKDAFWRKFRDYYLVFKRYMYRDFTETPYVIENQCYNGCIGVNSFDETLNSFNCNTYLPNSPACTSNPSYYDGYSDADQPCNSTYAHLYEDKNNVFHVFDRNIQYGYSTTYMNTFVTNAQNAMLQDCADECEDMADQWMIQLNGCGLTGSQETAIRAELVELCSNGCDIDNPWGTSTIPAGGTATANGNTTFYEVLEFHLGSGFEDDMCSDLLIAEPRPHSQDITPSPANLDTCGCDMVMTSSYNFDPNDPNNPQTLEEQFLADWGFVPSHNLSTLECACSYAFDTYAGSAYQPGATWPSGSVTELADMELPVSFEMTCSECVDCDAILSAKSALDTRFAGVSNFEDSPNYLYILQNYMNTEYNFHLAGSDFDEFLAQCNATSQDPYCTTTDEIADIIVVLDLLSKRGDLTVNQANMIDLAPIVPYQYSAFKDLMTSGDNYWTCTGSCPSGVLEMYFGTTQDYCEISFELPAGADFDFDDIVAIYDLTYDEDCGTSNYDFTVAVDYYSCGVLQTDTLDGTTDCFSVSECICDPSGLTLCDQSISDFAFDDECYQDALSSLGMTATNNYEAYIADQKEQFAEDMMEQCKLAFPTEEMEYTYYSYQYQFTLYYYNQKGNLVKTVPPKGVDGSYSNSNYVADIQADAFDVPAHTMATEYRYNSYGQLVNTTSPDGGDSKYWYDAYGRVVASQNAEQTANGVYTYVYYDEQGRVKEVGHTSGVTPSLNESIAKGSQSGFVNWVETGTQFEITRTFYDRPLNYLIEAEFDNGEQENVRLRIATVAYYEDLPVSNLDFDAASHYSYDQHGNVKEYLQHVPMLLNTEQDYVSTEYDYDLISGVMKEVVFEKGEAAQFIHQYYYDENNRLKEVYTSAKDLIEQREANYSYYEHGPMARVETGDLGIQGEDYVYTINGWLKGMNSNTLDEERDPGNDGTDGYSTNNPKVNSLTARDALGFTLKYFDDDYFAIGGSNFEATTASTSFGSATADLYNGNISHMVTAIQGLDVMGYAYTYDQLHRLKEVNAYDGVDVNNNTWSTGSITTDYFTSIEYDDNGNITSLERNALAASQLAMDDFTYHYSTGTNQLTYVDDAVGSTPYDDIQDQSSGNYTYDAIGRLTSDVSEGITSIVWREDSKIRNVTNSGFNPDLTFVYDPMGRRVGKLKKLKDQSTGNLLPMSDWVVEYYALDASGNVMGQYDIKLFDASQETTLTSHDIYGSGRIGRMNYDKTIFINSVLTTLDETEETFTRGHKYYEMTNHLGNVMTTVSDRKIHHPITTTMYYDLVDLDFTDLVNITQDAQTGVLTSAGGSAGWGNYGAASQQVLSGDGYVEWTMIDVAVDEEIVLGLSYTNTNANQNTIEYAWYIPASGNAEIRESGSTISTHGLPNDGDVFKIERDGSSIKYYKNTTLVRTITEYGSGDLLIDLAMNKAGTQIQSLVLYDENADYAYYTADQMSYSDYYAFGMQMPGRQSNTGLYDYGFQGQRKDDEIKGEGNSINYKYRMHDPRLGRFFTVDPLAGNYPHNSSYAFSENRVIDGIELEGLEHLNFHVLQRIKEAQRQNLSPNPNSLKVPEGQPLGVSGTDWIPFKSDITPESDRNARLMYCASCTSQYQGKKGMYYTQYGDWVTTFTNRTSNTTRNTQNLGTNFQPNGRGQQFNSPFAPGNVNARPAFQNAVNNIRNLQNGNPPPPPVVNIGLPTMRMLPTVTTISDDGLTITRTITTIQTQVNTRQTFQNGISVSFSTTNSDTQWGRQLIQNRFNALQQQQPNANLGLGGMNFNQNGGMGGAGNAANINPGLNVTTTQTTFTTISTMTIVTQYNFMRGNKKFKTVYGKF